MHSRKTNRAEIKLLSWTNIFAKWQCGDWIMLIPAITNMHFEVHCYCMQVHVNGNIGNASTVLKSSNDCKTVKNKAIKIDKKKVEI